MRQNSQPIDILFLSHQYNLLGGGEKALFETISYIQKKGLRVHVILGDKGSFADELEKLGIDYSIIFLPHWAHGGDDPSEFIFTSKNPTVNTTYQIYHLIKKLRPKLCVTNTIVVPWLGYAASLTATPHAWMIHELGTAGLNLRYAIGEEQTMRNIEALSDIIFFNSRYTEAYYRQFISDNIPREIIYPGGTPQKSTLRKNPYRTGSLKLVSVAQIRPQKGQFEAVKATNRLKVAGYNPHLIMVGLLENKEYVDNIQAYIAKNNLEENITLVGHKQNPSDYVKYADIALTTSANDSFGRVTVEAMHLGKPVVAANSAGSTEIIENSKTGYLYRPGSDKDLADKIIRLAKSKPHREKIAAAGHKFAAENFNEQHRFDPLMHYYDNLPSEKIALDLSLLGSTFIDYRRVVGMYNKTLVRVKHIEQSIAWRAFAPARVLKKLIRKISE